ncbi:MAG: amino acid ABC transporter permease [Hyphomicrobiales bacterium]|nr:MAG: amino acid ABC transporter permease [Hyphomicrobiales bacterium]
MPKLVNGVWMTILLSSSSIALGFVAGTLLAVARRSSLPILRVMTAAYVEVIRNTPLLIQIFLTFFGLSMLGPKLPAALVAVIAMTINTAAYTSEIVRAGFDSIKRGQWEAGEALGLTRLQVYWHVALLPALERVYPSLSSQFVLLMLATSITSQISVEELTGVANYIQAESYRPFETYTVIAVVYLALPLVLRGVLWAIGQVIFPRQRRLGRAVA